MKYYLVKYPIQYGGSTSDLLYEDNIKPIDIKALTREDDDSLGCNILDEAQKLRNSLTNNNKKSIEINGMISTIQKVIDKKNLLIEKLLINNQTGGMIETEKHQIQLLINEKKILHKTNIQTCNKLGKTLELANQLNDLLNNKLKS